jgi:hypothetical protein
VLLAEALLALSLGFGAEAASIPTIQVVCLHGIAVLAVMHTFNSGVYWRSMVEAIEDAKKKKADKQGLAALLASFKKYVQRAK